MPDFRKRARLATRIAAAWNYETEYESDDALLAELYQDGLDDVPDEDLAGVERYLVISTEYAGDGPADHAEFLATKAAATKHMGDYAREGWVSRLWDLDVESTEPIKERSPR